MLKLFKLVGKTKNLSPHLSAHNNIVSKPQYRLYSTSSSSNKDENPNEETKPSSFLAYVSP